YISRVNDEKVYDELDLRIAMFIVKRRDNKWSLNAIFDDLPNHFELRPFPENFPGRTSSSQVEEFEKIRATLKNEMKEVFKEIAVSQMEEQKREMENLLPSREQARLDRINAIMVERKITRLLEDKAMSLWNKKPAEERMKKVGWFRKEENRDKRDRFIKKYVDKHFEKQIKQEFDV